MTSPFLVNTVRPSDQQNTTRYEKTLAFIRELYGEILDCGERNPFAEMIESRFNIKTVHTCGDLDEAEIRLRYDFILAFEVLEHLMNPLWFLTQVKRALKSQGTFYLSTPINKPKFLWNDFHFHELDEYRLRELLKRAGFEIVREQRVRCYKFTGIRPILRYLFKTGTMLLELRVAQ